MWPWGGRWPPLGEHALLRGASLAGVINAAIAASCARITSVTALLGTTFTG